MADKQFYIRTNLPSFNIEAEKHFIEVSMCIGNTLKMVTFPCDEFGNVDEDFARMAVKALVNAFVPDPMSPAELRLLADHIDGKAT